MNTKHHMDIISAVKTAVIGVCSGVILIHNLPAQSVDVFQPLAVKVEPASAGDPTKSNPDVEQLKLKPSRYAIGNIDLYVNARMADFSMKNREIDIFGLHQDPDYKPPTNSTPNANNKVRDNIAPKALAEIIQGVKVQMVRVKDKSFLIGNRVIKEGEEFAIVFDNRQKNLKVIKVEAKQIVFRDLDSKKNEEATLKIELLPFGMEAGDDRLKPEGLVQPDENEPIPIEIN